MSRPIVLPELPPFYDRFHLDGPRGWDERDMLDFARAAVEADRKGIMVTDEDVEAAQAGPFRGTRAALECYAKRLRGETP